MSARMRRPDQRLRDDDFLSVERRGGRSMQPVAERERLAHAAAEGGVVRAGEQAVDRQSVGWRFPGPLHKGMARRVSKRRLSQITTRSWYCMRALSIRSR